MQHVLVDGQSPPSHNGSVVVPSSQKYSLLINGGMTPENAVPVLVHGQESPSGVSL